MKVSRATKIHLIIWIGVFLLLWLPVLTIRQVNAPKEDPQYIRRVFGEHTVGQVIKNEYPIHALSIVVRSEQLQRATLFMIDETGQQQVEQGIEIGPSDQWIRLSLNSPLQPGEHTLTFKGLPETTQDQAILLRFQIQSDLYSSGHMIVDGEESYGDLAFRTYQRVPLWQSFLIWGQVTDKAAWHGAERVAAGLVIAAVLLSTSYLIATKKNPRVFIVTLLIILALAAIVIRVPYLNTIQGIFGGDAFNYLSKAVRLTEGGDPFAADPRKGPLYSMLLLPGLYTANPLWWSRIVGIIAAAGTIVLLPFIGRHFKLSWGLAVGAGVLLAVNQDFIWESPSGLANTTYTFFVVLSTLAFLYAKDRKWQWILAISLGLTFLTRYEGGTLAAIYLPALWLRERLPFKRIAALGLVTAAIILIPQVSFIWSGESGIRTFDDLANDGGLAFSQSVDDFQQNFKRFQQFVRETWFLSIENDFTIPALGVGIIAGGVAVFAERRKIVKKNYYAPAIAGAALIALIALVCTKSSFAYEYIVAIPWLLAGLGLAPLFMARKFDAVAIAAMVVVQIIVVTYILPKPRYYLQLIPFFALATAFGISFLVEWGKGWYAKAAALVFLGILVSLLFDTGRQTLAGRAEKYNAQAQHTDAIIDSVIYLRNQPSPSGFRTDDEPPIVTMMPKKHMFLFPNEPQTVTAIDELIWLRDHNIKYAVERNEERIWQSVREYPELFEHLHTFDSIYGEAKVMIYGVDRAKLRELAID